MNDVADVHHNVDADAVLGYFDAIDEDVAYRSRFDLVIGAATMMTMTMIKSTSM